MTPQELVLRIPGLVAFWDFQDSDFTDRTPRRIRLTPMGNTPPLADEGVFGPHSLPFSAVDRLPGHYLVVEREREEALNIGGPEAEVTVVAWLAKAETDYKSCQFIAGVWNEHQERQYALFLNLAIRNLGPHGVERAPLQAAGHISSHGGATPGWRYCMDGAVGATDLYPGRWHTVATSYNGREIALYLDGRLDANAPFKDDFLIGANPYPYPGGIYKGSADFTIGATRRPERVVADGKGGFEDHGSAVANPFVGLLGGVAIFNRALTADEQMQLASIIA